MKAILFFLAVFSSSALACIPAADVAELESQFKWTDDNGKVDKDFCNPENLYYKIAEAILFLRSLPELDRTPDEFNQNILKQPPYDYLRRRIRKFWILEKTGPECKSNTMIAQQAENTIYFCPLFGKLKLLERAESLIHESRHDDGDAHFHVDCSNGFRYACDKSYASRGSYGMSAEFYVKLWRTLAADPEIRRQARSRALATFSSRFVKRPFPSQQGLAIQTEGGEVLFFNGRDITPLFTTPMPTVLSLVSDGLAIYDLQTRQVFGYEYAPQLSVNPAPNYEGRLNAMEQSSTLGAISTGDYLCYLFADQLKCFLGDDMKVIPFNWRARGFRQPSKSKTLALKSWAIVAEDGFTYALPKKFAKLNSDLKKSAVSSDIVNLVRLPSGEEFALRTDGALVSYSSRDRKWVEVPAFAGQRIRRIVPFVFTDKFLSL